MWLVTWLLILICSGVPSLKLLSGWMCWTSFFLSFMWQVIFKLIHQFDCWVTVRACGIFNCSMWDLFPWPGIESRAPELGAWGLSHWTSRRVPGEPFSRADEFPPPHCVLGSVVSLFLMPHCHLWMICSYCLPPRSPLCIKLASCFLLALSESPVHLGACTGGSDQQWASVGQWEGPLSSSGLEESASAWGCTWKSALHWAEPLSSLGSAHPSRAGAEGRSSFCSVVSAAHGLC